MPFAKLRDAVMEGVYPKDQQIEHLAAIRQSRPHDYLYDCMSILDTKASGLLQYDSIILAAATLALTFFPKGPSAGTILLFVALILSGLSSVASLQVIWVYWTPTADFVNTADEFTGLLRTRNRRTVMYRIAWMLAQVSVLFLILGILAREL
jgi:hypothetical protein